MPSHARLTRPSRRQADHFARAGRAGASTSVARRRAAIRIRTRPRWGDEAQESLTTVLSELRILASKDLDSKQLLCVIFAGDARLPERLRSPELLPLGSRIRRRLTLDYASRDELLACLDHLLAAAGNSSLMTSELRVTLADHAAGNYRVLMNLADELLAVATDRELARLDEKLFLEVFAQTPKAKPTPAARKR